MTKVKSVSKNINFNHSFKIFLSRINSEHIMEAAALCNYVHIYAKVNESLFKEEELKNWGGTSQNISGNHFLYTIIGDEYPCISAGYLGYNSNINTHFYRYKLAMHYSHIKLADCPDTDKAKNILLTSCRNILENLHYVELKEKQIDITRKYENYVLFNIKHILNYCAHMDSDFEVLGKEFFKDFENLNKIRKTIPFNMVSGFLNEHLDSRNREAQEVKKHPGYSLDDMSIYDARIAHIFNYLEGKEPVNCDIIKQDLSSHDKGRIGEELFGKFLNGEVVGHKNNKVDITDEKIGNISLKTSYSSTWNNHLAYLNNKIDSHALLSDAINHKIPLYKIKDINWHDIIKSFISGDESIHELAFQKIIMDDFNKSVVDVKVWRLPVKEILNIINNKQFIFHNNNIILFHENEQILKINIKKRSDKIQIMVLTDEAALDNAVANHIGVFVRPVSINKVKMAQ